MSLVALYDECEDNRTGLLACMAIAEEPNAAVVVDAAKSIVSNRVSIASPYLVRIHRGVWQWAWQFGPRGGAARCLEGRVRV